MYVIKNALKCIGRSKGRNFLIGLIVFVIAISACIALSIRQASENANQEILSSMSVTATISFDRTNAMSKMSEDGRAFDKSSFADKMGSFSSLTLEEYQTYAQAESVDDFYCSMTAYANGSEGFEPVNSDSEEEETTEDEVTTEAAPPDMMQGGNLKDNAEAQSGMTGKGGRIFGSNSDFSVVGYSGENAMTAFINGSATITDGEIFSAGDANYQCIITEELATFNDLSVGDNVQITNPNNEEELYTFEIVGIYSDSSANESSFSMFGATSNDPANAIYINYETLADIIENSAEASAADSENEITPISGTIAGTYVFSSVDQYEKFEDEAKALGLDETYTVTSPDADAFENSLIPLETLSTTATYFLIVILIIGGVILIVLNIFNIRERKYEIGVLTAIGMNKIKVSLQFLTEIFIVTVIAVVIGAGAGAASSVPITNALLANQVEAQNAQSEQVEENFGRGGMGGKNHGQMEETVSEPSYISEVSATMNLTVVLQMMGIGILLTIISGAVSMLFIMRYEPLKILANRD